MYIKEGVRILGMRPEVMFAVHVADVLALRMGLFESRDGGRSWQDKQVGRFSPTTTD